jgi:hypothetical protein
MDIYDILGYLLAGFSIVLIISLVYVLVKNPKEILYSILRGLKSDRIDFLILLSPLWIPVYLLDKQFKLGIYKSEDNEDSIDEDLVYTSTKTLNIDFSQYQKYIFINPTNLKELNKAIADCFEITPEEDFKGIKYNCNQNKYILKISDHCNFYNFNYLIQWFNTELNKETKNIEIFGLALNKSISMESFYVASDTTGQHINSLTGKTFAGDKFSIYLFDDFEKTEKLEINNKIKLDLELEINSLTTDFSNLEFVNFE